MYTCKYCGKEFDKVTQLAAHSTSCDKHPNHEEHKKQNHERGIKSGKTLKDKAKNNPLNQTYTYTFKCKTCGKEYTLELKEKDYKKGNYTKYCSKYCSHVRVQTEETKNKISNSLNEYHIKTNTQHIKYCKICGAIKGECKHPEICEHRVKSWWENFIPFGLDISKLGTEEIYNELNKVKNLLYEEYVINKLSPRDIYNKYNCYPYIKNSENILHIVKKFGFYHRGYKDAVKNAFIQGKYENVERTNQYHSEWHTSWNGKEVYLRSSYETDYANDLDKKQIDYDVEYLHIKYFCTKENTYKCAIPDFYLPETNTIVEIKSNWTFTKQEMIDKFKAYKDLGYNTKLILEHKEVDLYSL